MSQSASLPQTPTIRSEIAGMSVIELADKLGTPNYVYDAGSIKRRFAQLAAFDVVRYAQKANSNLAIVDLIRRLGGVVDAVSAGEILRALKVGYAATGDPPPIVYTADVFDSESLDLVCEHGIHCNLGSPDMIGQLADRLPGQSVTLRLNPGFGHGHSQKTNTGGAQSKHGIWHEQLGEVLELAARHGVEVSGLHMHIGSGTDLEHLAQVCGAMQRAAQTVGPSLQTISAGGGLPIPYEQTDAEIDLGEYHRLWDETRTSLAQKFGHPVRLEIEPGRFLSAESGYLITEIRAIKKMGENTFYLVDAGFNNLARPILYGAYHPMSIAHRGSHWQGDSTEVVVGGPLCESGDIFTQQDGGFVCSRMLPTASVGDLLIIECAGAYGSVMGSNYNSKPLLAEGLIENGSFHVIRRRQTLEELFDHEIIPPETPPALRNRM